MNKRYTGPVRQIEFDEGMGIIERSFRNRPTSRATSRRRASA